MKNMQEILIIGDSLVPEIAGPKHDIYRFCKYPGVQIKNLDEELKFNLKERSYQTIVIIGGTNDLGNGATPKELLAYFKYLILICMSFNIFDIIVVLPWGFFDKNEKITQKFIADFADIFEFRTQKDEFLDELHLNQKGNTRFLYELSKYIEKTKY